MSNKNILSIDLDYILAPCINLYNDLVNAAITPERVWGDINRLRQLDKHISYDDKNLKYVFDLFTNALLKLKDKNAVTFALNHDAILLELANEKYKDDTFTIFNVDHHHDIYYSEQGKLDVDKYDVAGVANWVWYLDKHKKITQYNWVCNSNSFFPENDIQSNGKMDAFTADKIPAIFDVKEWDYIFICNSPHWFPRDYDVFFEMLIAVYQNIAGNKVKIEENIFSPNGLSRPYPIKNQ